MYAYGIRCVVYDCFSSEIGNRIQCIRIANLYSELEFLNPGIPQGSILGANSVHPIHQWHTEC